MRYSDKGEGMENKISRRELLAGSAGLGAAALMPDTARAMRRGPNDRLRVAVIGGGGMGGYAVDRALDEEMVALCDVDDNTIAGILKDKVKDRNKPRIYNDYRKMFDEMAKDIDVVCVSTPDHHHAPAAIRAIKLGKHTFCQKPLAYNIYEADALAKAAKKYNVLTQMGNQGYCGEPIRKTAEWIQSGAIGDVVEAHTILGRNFGGTGGRPPSKPVPSGLHWDEWIGPAPYRDYHDELHPFNWRNWRAFGTGTVGDMACHHVAVPFMALKLWEVRKFTVECINTANGSDEKYPQDNIVCYHIPARPKFPACKLYVYDHQGLKPQIMKDTEKAEKREFGEFTLFVGTKGMIGSDGILIPISRHDELQRPAPTIPRAHGGGPVEDLYWCIRNNGTPASNFPEAASPLTILVLTSHLAQFAGKGSKIEFDMDRLRCTNLPDVNRYIRRVYRKGWEV